MEFTKNDLNAIRKDPMMHLFSRMLGMDLDSMLNEAEKKVEKKEDIDLKKVYEKVSTTNENIKPKYDVKIKDWEPAEAPSTLVEENNTTSFSMSAEELEDWIKDYQKLENTFKKLEHVFGIDLNASADSIYTQYNGLVWTLIEKIFGSDNRDDIADFCFGDSNLDTVKDLYEELV